MSIISLLARFGKTETKDTELVRQLAIGQALVRISANYKAEEVETDEAFSKKMAEMADGFYEEILRNARKSLEDDVSRVVGEEFGYLKAPIRENHDITKVNKEKLTKLAAEVASLKTDLSSITQVIEKSPWENISSKQFFISIFASLIASVVISVGIGWYGLEQKLTDISALVEILCNKNPTECSD